MIETMKQTDDLKKSPISLAEGIRASMLQRLAPARILAMAPAAPKASEGGDALRAPLLAIGAVQLEQIPPGPMRDVSRWVLVVILVCQKA